jgi:hypothetical protein
MGLKLMKYQIYKSIKNIDFLFDPSLAGFLIHDKNKHEVYRSEEELSKIDKFETIIKNNYDWDNVPSEFEENLVLYGEAKCNNVLKYELIDGKFKLLYHDNQKYLCKYLIELNLISFIFYLTDKRTTFKISNNIYTSLLTGKKYRFEILQKEDCLHEYQFVDLERNLKHKYWMAICKIYYILNNPLNELYSIEELVDLAVLEYKAFEVLNKEFKDKELDLYIEKYKELSL